MAPPKKSKNSAEFTATTRGEDEDLIWVTEFTEESAKEFVEKLIKASEKDPKKPLFIYIDSYGGYVDALTTMLSAIDSIPNKVVTICMGKAMSCGAMLLAHGDHRYVVPHGRVMVHEVSGGAGGNINDMKVDVEEHNRINQYMMAQLAKNCGLTLPQLLKKFTNKKRDIYLSPAAAVEFGVADKVGYPKLKKLIRYEIE